MPCRCRSGGPRGIGVMNIAVVGGGRMGLPLASVFAERGAEVVVCDVNPAVVDAVNAGRCPYEEPDLDTLMAEMHGLGRLAATTDTAAAVGRSETVVVIVPARLTPERDIDLSTLEAASAAVGRGLRRGSLVVYETTVAVGSTRHRLLPVLQAHSGLRAGADFLLAFSPERVKANTVLARLRTTPKIVGGLDVRSTRRAGEFYARYLGAPVDDVGTLEAAEMTKLLGMLYRDVNIALANELAAFCEMAGIDFTRARLAANSDGEANVLVPGIGVGGHCTPVYPYFLTRESRRQGLTQRLSEAAREINDEQPRTATGASGPTVATATRPARASPGLGLPAGGEGRHAEPGTCPEGASRGGRRARDNRGPSLHPGRASRRGLRARPRCRG